MSDEGKLRAQRDRGVRAQEILNSEIVKEAFDAIEQTIVDAWRNSAADDEKARYNAYLMQRLLKNFREQFTRAVSNGKVAEKELLAIHDKSKLRRVLHV